MCGLGVAVGCKSGQKKRLMCGAGWLLASGWSCEGFRAGKRQKLLMWLDGCKIGLTVESEEGEVPHLRWSQAPPLPWPRPGSADYIYIYTNYTTVFCNTHLNIANITFNLKETIYSYIWTYSIGYIYIYICTCVYIYNYTYIYIYILLLLYKYVYLSSIHCHKCRQTYDRLMVWEICWCRNLMT